MLIILISIGGIFTLRKKEKPQEINPKAEENDHQLVNEILFKSFGKYNLPIGYLTSIINDYLTHNFHSYAKEEYIDSNMSIILLYNPIDLTIYQAIIIEKDNNFSCLYIYSWLKKDDQIEKFKEKLKKLYSIIFSSFNKKIDSIFLSKSNIEKEISTISSKKSDQRLKTSGFLSKSEALSSIQEEKVDTIENEDNTKEKAEEQVNQKVKEEVKENEKGEVEEKSHFTSKFGEEEMKFYNIYLEGRKNFENNYENQKWEFLMEDKKSGLLGYKYDDEKGRRAIKATITVKTPVKTVFEYLCNIENKPKYDNNYEKGKVEKELNEYMGLLHIQYKGKILFSPRDFKSVVFRNIDEEKGVAEIFVTSYPSDESTHVKNVVRASVVFNFYRLLKKDENTTDIIFFVLTETGINQTLVNTILKDIVNTNKVLKNLLESKK